MTTLAKRSKNFRGAREFARSNFFWERDYEAVNVEALQGIIGYLKYLYVEGEISDKAYETLVSQVLSTFVENTIRFKVERIFDEVDLTLKEVDEALLSNVLI